MSDIQLLVLLVLGVVLVLLGRRYMPKNEQGFMMYLAISGVLQLVWWVWNLAT